jgi:hypothetical protein
MLQAWAEKTLPTLKHHLVMATKMNEDRRARAQTVGQGKAQPTGKGPER